MIKIKAIFFCDIVGTFDSHNVPRDSMLKSFKTNLSKIKEINRIDEFYFSFITSDKKEIIQKYFAELTFDIIKPGPQFYNQGYYYSNGENKQYVNMQKCDQIYKELYDNNYDLCFYADDQRINHILIQLRKAIIKTDIIVFSPIESTEADISGNELGLSGLNFALSKYIDTFEKKKIYR